MSNTNAFLAYASGGSPTVLSDAAWSALAARSTGFQTGILQPENLNKALRQGVNVAAMIGQFTADYGPGNVLDDGNISTLEAQFEAALGSFCGGIHYGIDAGAANALAPATLTPPIAAYADGQAFSVRPANTTTSKTPTFTAPGLAAKTIVRADGLAVGPGAILAGLPVLLAYDAALDRIILATPARRPAVHDVNLSYSSIATPTLALADIDKLIPIGGVGAITTAVTLPLSTNFDAGQAYWLQNNSPIGADYTVNVSAGDTFTLGIDGSSGSRTSFTLAYTETAHIVALPALNNWGVVGGSAASRYANGARSSLGSSGYKKIPDANAPRGYIILQWGTYVIDFANSDRPVSLPTAFPTAIMAAIGSSVSVNSYGGAASSGSTTTISCWGNNVGAGISWLAWGY